MKKITKYARNLIVAVNQLVNTVLGGDPDETISSRSGKARAAGKRWGCVLCRVLDFIDKKHCADAISLDEGKDAVLN